MVLLEKLCNATPGWRRLPFYSILAYRGLF